MRLKLAREGDQSTVGHDDFLRFSFAIYSSSNLKRDFCYFITAITHRHNAKRLVQTVINMKCFH